MLANYTYLSVDLGALLVPFIFSFHPKLLFYKTWKAFFKANLIATIMFILWDMLFTYLGVWGFNPKYLCGVYIYNLPIEEILFFFCIPYASLFTYHCFKLFLKSVPVPSRLISTIIIIVLIFVALASLTRLYTSVTFIGLGVFLAFITFVSKPQWLANFYLSFAVILIPFFIVNGILTGSWIDEPVVWYNNNENLSIRLLTIPVEDIFYGMLLLLLNTWLYERFAKS